ncbi:elongation factor 1-gamma, partial [Tanacetum coccineum]
MAVILHPSRKHKNAWKVLIAAEYVDAKVTLCKEFFTEVSDKPEKFLGWTPTGKPHVLETNEGYIYDSNANACYIGHGTNLMGKTVDEQVLIHSWIDFSSELDSSIMDL